MNKNQYKNKNIKHRQTNKGLFTSVVLCLGAFAASVSAMDMGYFENKVSDSNPEILLAANSFNQGVNDTSRLQTALNLASKEINGGVVILRPSRNGNNVRFSLARITVPSNTRLEVDPDVILEMRGVRETSNLNRAFLFSIGRSSNPNDLSPDIVENVEITSTDPNRRFTIDSKTNMPLVYGAQAGGNGGGGGNTFETGVSRTRSIAVGLFYVRNFAVSNLSIIDNHTESVGVQMYPDTDYKDGAYAIRHASDRSLDVFLDGPADDPASQPLPMNTNGDFIDSAGNVIEDMFAINRNPTWGRTPIKGTIDNIDIINAHTGYGAVQVYGGDWIKISNITALNGIGVRLEAGNGTSNDDANRAGPSFSTMTNIDISNVHITNGFTGVWVKPHSKIMENISIHNIEAIDSATALLVAKGTLCRECRDLTRGRVNNMSITGDITLRQTEYTNSVAEVGRLATFFLTQANRLEIAAATGKSVNTINGNDIPRNLSGSRWYLIKPVAPVLAISQLSSTNIGDQSAKEGFFPTDYSQATIINDGLTHNRKILYREDMRNPNGTNANDTIYH